MKRAARMDGIAGFGIDRVAAAVHRGRRAAAREPRHRSRRCRPRRSRSRARRWRTRSRTRGCRSRATSGCARRSPTTSPRGTGASTTRSARSSSPAAATEGVLDVLLATIDPGDEVVLTDPIYAGLVNRVRLAGGVPVFAPLAVVDGEWRLDRDALAAAISRAHRRAADDEPVDAVRAACWTREDWARGRAAVQRARPLPALRRRDGGARVRRPRAVSGRSTHEGMAERTVIAGSMSKALPDDRLARGLDRRAGLGRQRRRLGARLQHDRRRVRGAARGRGGAARAAGARGGVRGRVGAPARRDLRRAARAGRSCGPRAGGRCWSRRDDVASAAMLAAASRRRRWSGGAATSPRATCGSCSAPSRSRACVNSARAWAENGSRGSGGSRNVPRVASVSNKCSLPADVRSLARCEARSRRTPPRAAP